MYGFEYKVRFHLQRGKHYMHWQIKAYDGTVKYLDPNKYQIEMRGYLQSSGRSSADIY